MNKILISLIKDLLSTIKKVMPYVRNKHLARELMHKSIKIIKILGSVEKENTDKENNDVRKEK